MELELVITIKIYLVVNMSRITLYQEQIEKEKEYKVKNILNRRDVRGKPKYLV